MTSSNSQLGLWAMIRRGCDRDERPASPRLRQIGKWVVGILAAVVAALIAVPQLAEATPATPAVATYTYDAHPHASAAAFTPTDRGPPAGYDHAAALDAAFRWSHGVSVRPDGPATSAITSYNDTAQPARVTHVRGTTRGQSQQADGELSSLAQTGVATNTAAKACSFTGTTLVLMADGSRKPIEDIKHGDRVVATDPETGEQVAKTVEHVFVHDDTVIDLVVDGDVITTTEDHPFWSVTDQRFERADQLAAGEKVLLADGRVITVSELKLGTAREALAYNLSIEGIHTYHVGDAAILVHNDCPLPHVNWGQQSKHFPGHPNYIPGRSQLTANPELLIQRAGSGTPVGPIPRGQAGFKERIDFGDPIGTYVARDGTSSSTSIGLLHYRADGSVHIVPGRPY